MFLLLLMGLGAASVKAQVRIGGNTAPSAAAVLDLNASDAANLATGGLVLPRVNLTSNTMQLTNGVANQTGTMVYDVTATLGRIGVYYWNGNNWVNASLPFTSAADSGKVLMSTGSVGVWSDLAQVRDTCTQVWPLLSPTPKSFSLIFAADKVVKIRPWGFIGVSMPGLTNLDFCYIRQSSATQSCLIEWDPNILWISNMSGSTYNSTVSIGCYRPS